MCMHVCVCVHACMHLHVCVKNTQKGLFVKMGACLEDAFLQM